MAMRTKCVMLCVFGVLLLLLLVPVSALAASCRYCGRYYPPPAPGDEARVYALRAEHERTCSKRPPPPPSGTGVVTIYNRSNRDISYNFQSRSRGSWFRKTVKAGEYRYHWQTLPASFRIQFDSSYASGYQSKTYRLDYYVVRGRSATYKDGKPYRFEIEGQTIKFYTGAGKPASRPTYTPPVWDPPITPPTTDSSTLLKARSKTKELNSIMASATKALREYQDLYVELDYRTTDLENEELLHSLLEAELSGVEAVAAKWETMNDAVTKWADERYAKQSVAQAKVLSKLKQLVADEVIEKGVYDNVAMADFASAVRPAPDSPDPDEIAFDDSIEALGKWQRQKTQKKNVYDRMMDGPHPPISDPRKISFYQYPMPESTTSSTLTDLDSKISQATKTAAEQRASVVKQKADLIRVEGELAAARLRSGIQKIEVVRAKRALAVLTKEVEAKVANTVISKSKEIGADLALEWLEKKTKLPAKDIAADITRRVERYTAYFEQLDKIKDHGKLMIDQTKPGGILERTFGGIKASLALSYDEAEVDRAINELKISTRLFADRITDQAIPDKAGPMVRVLRAYLAEDDD